MMLLDIVMVQNVILVLCFTCMAGYLLSILKEKKPHWFPQSKRNKDLLDLEKRYEQTRNSRRESLQHYFWAQSSKEEQKRQRMEKQVQKMDEQLADMKAQYQLIRNGKSVPLKTV